MISVRYERRNHGGPFDISNKCPEVMTSIRNERCTYLVSFDTTKNKYPEVMISVRYESRNHSSPLEINDGW